MIEDLTIHYTCNGLAYAVSVDTNLDNLVNLPYLLGNAFAEIVNRSSANPEIVLDQMREELDLPVDETGGEE